MRLELSRSYASSLQLCRDEVVRDGFCGLGFPPLRDGRFHVAARRALLWIRAFSLGLVVALGAVSGAQDLAGEVVHRVVALCVNHHGDETCAENVRCSK